MTYNPNIPQATNIPAQSQGEFLINFQQLNTIFDVDHIPFNDSTSANRGKHDKSTYVELSANPTTSTNEISLFSKDVSGSTRLFLRQENAGSVIQLSGFDPVAANPGSTFLPGNMLMNFGSVNSSPAGAPVTFNRAFSSSVFSVVVTSQNTSSSSNATVESITTTGCTVYSSSTNAVYYIAIGR